MRVWTGLRGGAFGGSISPPGREPGEVGGERGVWDEAGPEEGGAPWETRGLAGGVMTSLEAEVADRGATQLEGSSRQLVWGLELKGEDGAGATDPGSLHSESGRWPEASGGTSYLGGTE